MCTLSPRDTLSLRVLAGLWLQHEGYTRVRRYGGTFPNEHALQEFAEPLPMNSSGFSIMNSRLAERGVQSYTKSLGPSFVTVAQRHA